MYYVKYNGIDLTSIIKVKEVEIPSLPSIDHSSIEVFERDGNIYNGTSYGNRDIKIKFIIQPDDPDDYDMYINDVKRAFYTKEEAQLYCGSEDLYIWCVPIGDMVIAELGPNCSEGEVELIAYDPYWYSTKYTAINNENSNKFSVENNSDTKVYPVIDIGFTDNTTFFQIENQTNSGRILIGGIPTVSGTTIKRDSIVLHDNMESTTDWVNSSAPIDNDRSTGGTISVTSNGKGVMCGDFGSSSGATWHGACYRKSLGMSITDFKVKLRMSHNSTGTNGDPTHPYTNDTETVISGSKTTYYVVTPSVGLRLRASASTSSRKLLTMPKGTKLTGTLSKGWLKTTYNGTTGYCYAQYLKKVTSDTTTTNKQSNFATLKSTAIRASADKKATNKKSIPAGKCIRVYTDKKYPTTGKDDVKEKFYKLAKPYEGVTGYVLIESLINASEYTVDYDYELNTADDKTGIVEVYGFSSNNVQLFRMGLYDDNRYWEFTYPVIRKNGEDFLKDKTVAPKDKTITTFDNDGKNVEKVLSGKYGDWNEFYGELYIERVNNVWRAYVQRIKDGVITKEIKSKSIKDTKNKDEKLAYIVIYYGTTGDIDKASCMAVTDIQVKTATAIDNSVTYNFQEFKPGDILTIDNNVPKVTLNNVECNELIDIGSYFFPLEPGENIIKFASDDTPSVDIIWNDKYL